MKSCTPYPKNLVHRFRLLVALVATALGFTASAAASESAQDEEMAELKRDLEELKEGTDALVKSAEALEEDSRGFTRESALQLEQDALDGFDSWRMPLDLLLSGSEQSSLTVPEARQRAFMALGPAITEGNEAVLTELRRRAPALSAAHVAQFGRIAQIRASEGYALKLQGKTAVVVFNEAGDCAFLSQGGQRAEQHALMKTMFETSKAAELIDLVVDFLPDFYPGGRKLFFNAQVTPETPIGPMQETKFRPYLAPYLYSLVSGTDENEKFNWIIFTSRKAERLRSARPR